MPTWHSKANYAGCLSVKLICSKNCIVCQQKCSSWEDAKITPSNFSDLHFLRPMLTISVRYFSFRCHAKLGLDIS